MEESTVSFPILYSILNASMLGGGSVVAVCVWRWHRRNPPDRTACTRALVARAWDTLHLGILLFAILLLFLVGSGSAQRFGAAQLPAARLAIIALIYVLMLALLFVLNRQRGITWEGAFGMGPENLHLLRFSPVLYLSAMPFLMITTQGYHWILHHWFDIEITLQDVARAITEERTWLEAGYILITIFAAPVYEELVYRGILFPYFVKYIGLTGGTLAVSLIFALTHAHLPSILPLFLLSGLLCLSYWRTGSLWVSIGIHAIFNTIGTIAIKLTY